MRRSNAAVIAAIASPLLVAANLPLKLQYSVQDGDWRDYAEVVVPLDAPAIAVPSQVVAQVPDTHEQSLCSDLWKSISGVNTIKFGAYDANGNHLGLSECDLSAVKNYKGLCRVLSNVEFVVELNSNRDRIVSALARPPSDRQEQVSMTRLGFVSLVNLDRVPDVEEPLVQTVLKPDKRGGAQEPPPKNNWWWGFLVAIIVMQVLNAVSGGAKEEAAGATAAPPVAGRTRSG